MLPAQQVVHLLAELLTRFAERVYVLPDILTGLVDLVLIGSIAPVRVLIVRLFDLKGAGSQLVASLWSRL
jgi:hypothetical protein